MDNPDRNLSPAAVTAITAVVSCLEISSLQIEFMHNVLPHSEM